MKNHLIALCVCCALLMGCAVFQKKQVAIAVLVPNQEPLWYTVGLNYKYEHVRFQNIGLDKAMDALIEAINDTRHFQYNFPYNWGMNCSRAVPNEYFNIRFPPVNYTASNVTLKTILDKFQRETGWIYKDGDVRISYILWYKCAEDLPQPHSESYWRAHIAQVHLGMEREQVEKILPVHSEDQERDAGSGSLSVYAADSEWIVEIPYDNHGLDLDPKRNPYLVRHLYENRVMGRIRLVHQHTDIDWKSFPPDASETGKVWR